MTIHEFSFGHCRIEVEETPPVSSQAETLVFVHGRLAGGEFWGPLVERLAERFRCLIVHLPGFGRSLSFEGRPLSLHDCATLVCQVLERLVGTEKQATLIGHDFGGAIAQLSGIQCGQGISGLVLINPASLLGAPFQIAGFQGWKIRGWARRLLRHSVWKDRDYTGWIQSQWKNRVGRAELMEAVRELEGSWPGPFERRYWREELKKLRPAVLLLWGGRDELSPVEGGLDLMKALPTASFFQDDCGHWPQLENPDWVTEKVREFLFALGRVVWSRKDSPESSLNPVRRSLSR